MSSTTRKHGRSDKTKKTTDSNKNGDGDHSTILVNPTLLSYQYRGNVNIPTNFNASKSVKNLSSTHHTMRLGLGTPLYNLKSHHIVTSKKPFSIETPINKNLIPGYKLKQQKMALITPKKQKMATTTPGGDPGSQITSRMKLLTIYESPKSSAEDFSSSTTNENNKNKNLKPKKDTVFEKAFAVLDRKANMLSLGQKVSYNLGGKKLSITPKNPVKEESVENAQAVSSLCRHFRNILGWKISLHCNWKYLEERVKLWPSNVPELSLEDVANLLKISVDNIKQLRFSAELEIIFDVLRKSLCHVNLQNIAKMLALSKMQEGKPELAARFLSECTGMFLHSEIIDKHLTFIRRNEEALQDSSKDSSSNNSSPRDNEDANKCKMYWAQTQHTLDFSNDCFDVNGENNFKNMTAFDPNWNVVQIATSIQSSNRFAYDLIGTRKAPQLFLSVFGHLPKRVRKQERSHFTTLCSKPLVDPGSQMRYGIIEEFEKLLDKNLMISDEKIVISRKKYWEERSRHNDAIEGIMEAMQDWIYPWIFLLPGTIADSQIQDQIVKEVLSIPILKNCTDTQKYLIYRMTENYNILPMTLRTALGSLVASILEIDEIAAEPLAHLIEDVGLSISQEAPRNPTVLVLDQDIEILPWDWLPCLRSTSVTRMPSLNIMRSSNAMWSLMNGDSDYGRIIDPTKCTFILNPDGSLPQVQTRLEQYFRDREDWTPIVARSPTATEMQTALENEDLLVYCGHGAGANFYPEYAIQKLLCRAIPILMGCSSAQCHFSGPRLYGNSYIHAYLIAGCSSAVGFLWEVTDTECDRVTVELLERWIPHKNAKPPRMPMFDSDTSRPVDKYLVDALRKSRLAATQLVTQCSAVCYGLPTARAK